MSVGYTYTDDLLTAITTPTTTYGFTYGNFSLRESVKIGTRTLASYTYETGTNRLEKLDFGNGDRVEYEYDGQGRLKKQTYEDGQSVSFAYDNSGNLATVTDSETGIVTTYYYDLLNRNVGYREQGTNLDHSVTYIYDEDNNLASMTEIINGVTKTYSYTYDEDNRLISETVDGITVVYEYDGFGRLSTKTVKEGETVKQTDIYGYTDGNAENSTSTQVSSYNGFTYTYDKNGNILSVSDGTNTTSYVYDSQNQLIRENNQAAGKTWAHTYDNAGNIKNRREYAYTTGELSTATSPVFWEYDSSEPWGDLLAYRDGNFFTYDEIGNPLSDGEWTYSWKHGRQLVSMSDGTTTWNYTYNADGLRTKRTNGTDTYTYVYSGSQLAMMSKGNDTLHFTYDATGIPLAVKYNGTTYYYKTNLQGDVIGIVDSSGTAVVTYAYDAWGVLLACTGTMAETLGTVNPLTYRGYVYDRETGLYYVSSRYYDPEIGRWINADNGFYLEGNGDPISFNLFAYCMNNPVNRVDPTGNWSIWATVGVVVGAAICIAAVTVLTCGVGTATLAGAVAVGAAKGALIGAAAGTLVGGGIGYAATGTLEGAIEGAAIGFGVGAVVGAVAGAKAGAGSWYNSMAQEFTNAGSNEVVLGRSGTYEAVAESRGSTYFHTTDARWTEVHDMFGVGDKGMWNINKAFLNQQISAGSTFALANNPATSGGYYFMKEVAYLASKGISMLPIF